MSSEIIKEIHQDNRGYLATFPFVSARCLMSFNDRAGTLRGLHFREPPEEKLVLCMNGSVYDVILDLETGEWFPLYMATGIPRYVGKGFAHGFQTLEDDTQLFYVISETYEPDLSKGIRFDSFGIKWPLPIAEISKKDDELPYLSG